MPDWLSRYVPDTLSGRKFWLAAIAITVATFLLSIVLCVIVLIRIPADYFHGHRPPPAWRQWHPVLRWLFFVGKNLLGLFLVLLGVVMSLPGVPGQGILTVLMGAMLLNFPGKRRVERWLVSRRGVLKTINRIRARYGRPPLTLDGPAAGA